MRKALFTLGMIAAAFAGGAVANGQGLALARALIRTLANKSDFVRVVDAPPREGAEAPSGEGPAPAHPVPAATPSLLIVNRQPEESETKETAKSDPVPPARPEPSTSPEAIASAAPAPLPSSAVELSAPMPAPVSAAPPRDAAPAAQAPPPEIQPPRPPRPDGDESTARAVLTSGGSDATSRPRTSDWKDLRKRMAQAGVTRFEVDAELQGRVRFRCVIPVAGRRAVAQIFEGEGVDEFQAAESALKRVQLWRVSEGTAAAN